MSEQNKPNMILEVMKRYPKYTDIINSLDDKRGAVGIYGISSETQKQQFIASLCNDAKSSVLIVLPNENLCLEYEEQLDAYGVEGMYFPSKTQLLGISALSVSGGTETKRTEQLVKLLKGGKNIVITNVECLMQSIAPVSVLKNSVIHLEPGDEVIYDDFVEALITNGYVRAEICDDKGLFTVRGGRIDVFPCNSEYPVRIEFYGDEIDTLRYFDTATQRSIDSAMSVDLYPATEAPVTSAQKQELIKKLKKSKATQKLAEELAANTNSYRMNQMLSLIYDETSYLTDYLPDDTTIILCEPKSLLETAKFEYEQFTQRVEGILLSEGGQKYLWDLMRSESELFSSLNQQKLVMFSSLQRPFSYIAPNSIHTVGISALSSYYNDLDLLKRDIINYIEREYAVVIFAGRSSMQIYNLFSDETHINTVHCSSIDDNEQIKKGQLTVVAQSMPHGFDYTEMKLVVITEDEIFARSMHRKQAYSRAARRATDKIDRLELSKLEVGDYIVHKKYGIAKYCGIKNKTSMGRSSDYVALLFAKDEELDIPCDKIDCIHKYVGTSKPALSSLSNNTAWTNRINSVRKSVKKLAFNLVEVYGKRSIAKGYKFSPDTDEQKMLENDFPYDETADQLISLKEIKADMESEKVMDRLLCGDVGFGKTEVALRAAFKAVMDLKQVAILVPTTVLAYQHYNTISERFSRYGVNVEYLSRYKTAKEKQEIQNKLRNGDIQVIVGTQSLLSEKVKFYDLGLLIIDEEQRFGVGDKEKIKVMKQNIDVLTLSATPIPRTLHMSLIGIRDISLLDTPPKQRYPVQTFVTEYDEQLICNAVRKELGRGGQVYILYNNVENMPSYAQRLRELMPEYEDEIECANGQMDKNMLENRMLDFVNGRFSILVSSTIIENGIDVPNANTLIVLNSERLGLSQMYQLRGRVGRSNKIGFAYFTYQKNTIVSQIAEDRLSAITQFTELGSGYKISMRDLQIRGAGDLLGAEQSGHMEAIGYELYSELIAEAVAEAKNGAPVAKIEEAEIVVPFDAYLPRSYIDKEEWRLQIYKKIAKIHSVDDADDVVNELIDRFGTDEKGNLQKPLMNLINVASAKALATDCYIRKLTIDADSVTFIMPVDAPYNTDKLIEFINKYSAKMSANGKNCIITIPDVNADKAKICSNLINKTLPKLRECIQVERNA